MNLKLFSRTAFVIASFLIFTHQDSNAFTFEITPTSTTESSSSSSSSPSSSSADIKKETSLYRFIEEFAPLEMPWNVFIALKNTGKATNNQFVYTIDDNQKDNIPGEFIQTVGNWTPSYFKPRTTLGNNPKFIKASYNENNDFMELTYNYYCVSKRSMREIVIKLTKINIDNFDERMEAINKATKNPSKNPSIFKTTQYNREIRVYADGTRIDLGYKKDDLKSNFWNNILISAKEKEASFSKPFYKKIAAYLENTKKELFKTIDDETSIKKLDIIGNYINELQECVNTLIEKEENRKESIDKNLVEKDHYKQDMDLDNAFNVLEFENLYNLFFKDKSIKALFENEETYADHEIKKLPSIESLKLHIGHTIELQNNPSSLNITWNELSGKISALADQFLVKILEVSSERPVFSAIMQHALTTEFLTRKEQILNIIESTKNCGNPAQIENIQKLIQENLDATTEWYFLLKKYETGKIESRNEDLDFTTEAIKPEILIEHDTIIEHMNAMKDAQYKEKYDAAKNTYDYLTLALNFEKYRVAEILKTMPSLDGLDEDTEGKSSSSSSHVQFDYFDDQ